MTRQPLLRLFALSVWAHLPPGVQFFISRLHARIYESRMSRWLIYPYALLNYVDGMDYAKEFGPADGGRRYRSFQDFFTRKIIVPRLIDARAIWPCDGLLCDYGSLDRIGSVNIKGEVKSVDSIFGPDIPVPETGFFANIFLHNCDYHRVHAPVSGEIRTISRIPGELRFLRPWFYRDPSLPAMTNERVNIEIESRNERGIMERWLLAIVGGPGVATIEVDQNVAVGQFVHVGQELGLFRLGSTCCMITPVEISDQLGVKVRMGDPLF